MPVLLFTELLLQMLGFYGLSLEHHARNEAFLTFLKDILVSFRLVKLSQILDIKSIRMLFDVLKILRGSHFLKSRKNSATKANSKC